MQSWISSGATNYGWLIRCTDENLHNQDSFYQLDTANASLRPKLVISDLPVVIAGDITGDGHVDVVDLLTLADSWGKNLGQRGYDPKCDLNSDGSVDVVDLLWLAGSWGM